MGYCHRDSLGEEVWVVVVGGSAGTTILQAVAHPVAGSGDGPMCGRGGRVPQPKPALQFSLMIYESAG